MPPARDHAPGYDPPKVPPVPPRRFTPPSLPRPVAGPDEPTPAVSPRPQPRTAETIRELPPAASGWADEPVAPEPDLGGRVAFQLVRVVDGFPLARHVFTHGIVRVGRGEDCDLRLDDPLVSRYHALIERQPGERYVLHDQLSSNGIRVNGARVDRACRLQDGDVMLLGHTRLVFQTQLASRTLPPGSLDDLVIDDRPPSGDPLAILTTPPSDAVLRGAGAAVSPFFGVPPDALAPAAPASGSPATPAPAPVEQRPASSAAGAGQRAQERSPAPAADAPGGVGPSTPANKLRASELFELATQAPGLDELAPAPTLDPSISSPSSDDEPLPAPAEGVFGRTLTITPERARADQREVGVAERAFLRETEPGRWSASLAVPARAQHLITRDAYLLGAGDDVDLRLQGRLMPRVVAVVVRGLNGFSVLQVAAWPWVTKINGRVVADQERLEDGDVVTVAGRCFTFHRGLPGATPGA